MHRFALVVAFALCAPVAGCSCDNSPGNPDSGLGAMDGAVDTGRVLIDGNGFDVNAPLPDAPVVLMDGNGVDVNGPMPDTGLIPNDGNGFDAPGGCIVTNCPGRPTPYQCGNCVDDDMDGLIDSQDPDCLGPCGNNEGGYDPMIPGISLTNCTADCFYDQNGGSGDDGCVYDYRCDPDAPDIDPAHPMRCAYSMADAMNPSICPPTQIQMCHDVCGPLTPNGCDCFGCCEVNPGMFVFVGSIPEPGHPACNPSSLNDPLSCRPCNPVMDCLNSCGHCELCFNQHMLPADCFPPPPVDMGMPDAFVPDAPFPDGGHPDAYIEDAYTPPNDAGIPPRCGPTIQPCGLPGDALCGPMYYCISGCCQYVG